MNDEKKPKITKKYEVKINCPCCKKALIVKISEKIITPSEPAEKEQIVEAIKDTQSTL